jgi:hypothetical protein
VSGNLSNPEPSFLWKLLMKISHISRWTPLAKLDSWRHLVWLLHVEGGALSGGLPRRSEADSEADIGCKGVRGINVGHIEIWRGISSVR